MNRMGEGNFDNLMFLNQMSVEKRTLSKFDPLINKDRSVDIINCKPEQYEMKSSIPYYPNCDNNSNIRDKLDNRDLDFLSWSNSNSYSSGIWSNNVFGFDSQYDKRNIEQLNGLATKVSDINNSVIEYNNIDNRLVVSTNTSNINRNRGDTDWNNICYNSNTHEVGKIDTSNYNNNIFNHNSNCDCLNSCNYQTFCKQKGDYNSSNFVYAPGFDSNLLSEINELNLDNKFNLIGDFCFKGSCNNYIISNKNNEYNKNSHNLIQSGSNFNDTQCHNCKSWDVNSFNKEMNYGSKSCNFRKNHYGHPNSYIHSNGDYHQNCGLNLTNIMESDNLNAPANNISNNNNKMGHDQLEWPTNYTQNILKVNDIQTSGDGLLVDHLSCKNDDINYIDRMIVGKAGSDGTKNCFCNEHCNNKTFNFNKNNGLNSAAMNVNLNTGTFPRNLLFQPRVYNSDESEFIPKNASFPSNLNSNNFCNNIDFYDSEHAHCFNKSSNNFYSNNRIDNGVNYQNNHTYNGSRGQMNCLNHEYLRNNHMSFHPGYNHFMHSNKYDHVSEKVTNYNDTNICNCNDYTNDSNSFNHCKGTNKIKRSNTNTKKGFFNKNSAQIKKSLTYNNISTNLNSADSLDFKNIRLNNKMNRNETNEGIIKKKSSESTLNNQSYLNDYTCNKSNNNNFGKNNGSNSNNNIINEPTSFRISRLWLEFMTKIGGRNYHTSKKEFVLVNSDNVLTCARFSSFLRNNSGKIHWLRIIYHYLDKIPLTSILDINGSINASNNLTYYVSMDDIAVETVSKPCDSSEYVYWSDLETGAFVHKNIKLAVAHKVGHRCINQPQGYVNQILCKTLDKKVSLLLNTLRIIDDRVRWMSCGIEKIFYENINGINSSVNNIYGNNEDNPKFNFPNRVFTIGVREAIRSLKHKKLQAVIVAPDIEGDDVEGSLRHHVVNILTQAKELNIPVIFALNRHRIGRAMGKYMRMSVLGLLSTKGVQEQFNNIVYMANMLQKLYQFCIEQNLPPNEETFKKLSYIPIFNKDVL